MTYDAQVSTDVEGALIDLRDALDGLTGWAVEVDNIGNTLENGNDVVVSTPNNAPDTGNAEAFRFWYERSYNYHINLQLGEWDGAAYTNRTQTIRADLMTGNNNLESTDSVEYWLQRKAANGFVMYIRRTQQDGNDAPIWFAYSILNKLWAYDTAADIVESHGGIILVEGTNVGNQANQRQWTMYNTVNSWEQPRGLLNPDTGFDDYLVRESLHQTDELVTQAGQRPYIGTQDLFVQERSGDDVQSQDTVLDGADTVYEVVKFLDPSWDLLIRAD